MKKILSNNITATAAQPFKQGTWIHLQEGIAESLEALARQSIGPNYDATKVYILFGCVNSTVAPIYTVSAGAVFYGGEVYYVPAFTFTAAAEAVGAIDVTYFAGANADPVEFTDGIDHNVHAIRQIVVTDVASVGNLDFDNWIRVGAEDQIQVGVTPGAPAFTNSWTAPLIGLWFRRDNTNKTVTIHGVAQRTPIPVAPAAGSQVFTLPAGYRPTLANSGFASALDSNNEMCNIVVNIAGELIISKIASSVGSVAGAVYFSCTFYID